MKSFAWIILTLLSCQQQAPLGSKDNPVKLFFNPIEEGQEILKYSKDFIQFLEKETGLYFKTGITATYIPLVEAFGASRVDIGRLNPFGYIVANEKYGVSAKLRVIRHGKDHYQGQIIANVDRNIKTLSDLIGKKFAFTDPNSTSGYMFAQKLLKQNNIKLGEVTFGRKHDNVVMMVYQGQVDAGATYYLPPGKDGSVRDARSRVLTQFPDVLDKVKSIAQTEKIPNDCFVFRKGLDKNIEQKFIAAVKKFTSNPKNKKLFQQAYGFEGVVDTTDKNYDILREVISAINIDPVEQLKNR